MKEKKPEKSDLVEIMQEIIALKAMLKPAAKPQKKWMKSAEAMEALGCSHGTLRNHRNSGLLKFIKIGGSYYYDTEQVYELLNN